MNATESSPEQPVRRRTTREDIRAAVEAPARPPSPPSELATRMPVLLEHLREMTAKAEESKRQAETDMNDTMRFARSIMDPILHEPGSGQEATEEEIDAYLQVLEMLAPVVLDLGKEEPDEGLALTRRLIGQRPQPGYVSFMKLSVRAATSTRKWGHIAKVARALGQHRQRFAESWVERLYPGFGATVMPSTGAGKRRRRDTGDDAETT